jgi:hypothetical protein
VATLSILNEVDGSLVWEGEVDARLQVSSGDAWRGANWPRHVVLPTLASGFYRVEVERNAIEQSQRLLARGSETSLAPLAVLPATPGSTADVLVLLDKGTWQAYNEFGGRSYYTQPWATEVSSLRPGYLNVNRAHLREIVQLLDGLGIPFEVADSDWVEDHPGFLSSYRVFVIADQMEYVTRELREEMQAFFDSGGHVLALGAEFSMFQTRREGSLRITYKFVERGPDPILGDGDPSNDHLASYEWARVGEPETRLFGTAVWLAGFSDPELGTVPWSAHRTGHWLFEGTGLQDGDPFGRVGPNYRWVDGTLVEFIAGQPFPSQQELTETPDDFLVLATAPALNARPWWCWLAGTPKHLCVGPGWATVGIRQSSAGGTLLVIPQKGWLLELGDEDARLRRIVENALVTLAGPAAVDAYSGYALEP